MPIFDQGYQHWSGELTGHGWRWLAITRHGVRIGMKNRLLRIALLNDLAVREYDDPRRVVANEIIVVRRHHQCAAGSGQCDERVAQIITASGVE